MLRHLRGEADFEHPYWEDGDGGFLLLLTSIFATLAKFRKKKKNIKTHDIRLIVSA